MFVRGHLMSYARFLSLDPSDIIDTYDRTVQNEPSPLEHLDRRVRGARRPPRARWLLAAALAGAALVAVYAIGLLHGPGERPSGQVALPSLPPRIGIQAASRDADARAPRMMPVAPAAAGAPIVLALNVSERCWVEVVADGKTVFSGVLASGAVQSFTATSSLGLSLGNAGVAVLALNGRSVPLHATGVWRGTFGPSGLLP